MATAPVESVQWLPTLLMTAGLVVLGVVMTATIRNRIARRRYDAPDPRDVIARVKRASGGRDEMAEAEARVLDTARRLGAQLDNKAARLEHLLAEADQKIEALRGIAAASSAAAPRISPPVASARPVVAAPDPLTRTVYALADEGRGPTAIAQELDEPIGKVELILALRESEQRTANSD